MNIRLTLLMVAVALLMGTGLAFAEEGWLENLDDGLKQGKEQGKRVLVDFTATWCGWCTKLKEEVFDKAEFKDYAAKQLVLVSIDADKNKDLVSKHGVTGFPTILVLDGEGKTLDKVEGFLPYDGFMASLKKTEGAAGKPAPAPAATDKKEEEKK